MSRLRRLTVIDQAEIELRELIRQGRWKGRLPGYQVLADVLGVSVPTIGRAVSRLVQSGILVSRGQRKAFDIAPGAAAMAAAPAAARAPSRAGQAPPGNYLLVLGPVAMDQLDSWSRQFVTDAIRQLAREGWRCDYEPLDYLGAERPSLRWDRLLERHPATHLVVFRGNPVIADWALARGLKVLFIGGSVRNTGVSRLGYNIWEVAAEAVRRAVEMGHRRVLLPLFDVPPKAKTNLPAAIGPHLGLTPEQVLERGMVMLLGCDDPARRLRALGQQFKRVQPTFILCVFFRDYLQVTTYLRSVGVGIPEDVSVAVCGRDALMPYLVPSPTHYDLRIEPVMRQIHIWLRGRKPDEEAPSKAIPGSFVKGATLAPPPRPN
jgi:DNA-binding LacI/PurR family transcriptional regulator